jgi:LysM repeat protein
MERKRCPACGSRVDANAASCEMCGHVFGETRSIPKAEIEAGLKRPQAKTPPIPKFRAPKPVAAPARNIPWGVFGVIGVILLIGGAGFLLLRNGPSVNAQPTPTAIVDFAEIASTEVAVNIPSPVPTLGPQSSPTFVFPTRTPLPAREYTVVSGDTCGGIAQKNGVALDEFMRQNQLNERTCLGIQVGGTLLIPPPTVTPGPTETISPDYTPPPPATALPPDFVYEVKRGDSCGGIAQQFGVTVDDILRENSSLQQQCLIREGDKLNIRKNALPAVAFNVTPSLLTEATRPSAYRAPELLAPVNDAAANDDTLTLEWLSVGELRANEFYVIQIQPSGAITVPIFETKSTSIRLTDAMLDTEPERAFTWWVQVRQKLDTSLNGVPVYNDLGPASSVRRFVWQRRLVTPTPAP